MSEDFSNERTVDAGSAGTPNGLYQRGGKRLLDTLLAGIGLAAFAWLIGLAIVAATVDTRKSGLFRQVRVGAGGRPFVLFKIRTMWPREGTVLTSSSDDRITRLGRLFRASKIDELPQLLNVLRGDMSFVGPRPEVPEYAEMIHRMAPELTALRPGITGPATIKYRDEERLLSGAVDAGRYNDEVILPDKVELNLRYAKEMSATVDLRYILKTLRILA